MTELFSPTDLAEQLVAAGMNHAQALIIAKGLEASRNGVATKADLDAAVQTLRAEIAAAEARMEARLLVFKAEIETQLAKLEARFEVRFRAIESRMDKIEAELVVMRWCFGLMFTLQFGILAKLFFP